MRVQGLVLGGLLAAGAGTLYLHACAGPEPEVRAVVLRPPDGPGAPVRVEARLHNAGPGTGEVEVTVRLERPIQQDHLEEVRKLDLAPHEDATVMVDFPVPAGDYVPAVQARYPPR